MPQSQWLDRGPCPNPDCDTEYGHVQHKLILQKVLGLTQKEHLPKHTATQRLPQTGVIKHLPCNVLKQVRLSEKTHVPLK